MPLIPILGAGATIYMVLQLPTLTWMLLGVWTAIGMTTYFVYGMRNSTIGKREASGKPWSFRFGDVSARRPALRAPRRAGGVFICWLDVVARAAPSLSH